MPILKLSRDTPQAFRQFSVIGCYGKQPFVVHVALLRQDTSLTSQSRNIPVWHMGPPLIAGERSLTNRAAKGRDMLPSVDLVGHIELDQEEIEGIFTWLDLLDKEQQRPDKPTAHYCVSPPFKWVTGENQKPLYRQFSCIGFVMDCYRSIEINLIDDSETQQLPGVDLELVLEAYPRASDATERAEYGLSGPGPWKIILPGYVFHSLNRDFDTVRNTPYIPQANHWNFEAPAATQPPQ